MAKQKDGYRVCRAVFHYAQDTKHAKEGDVIAGSELLAAGVDVEQEVADGVLEPVGNTASEEDD